MRNSTIPINIDNFPENNRSTLEIYLRGEEVIQCYFTEYIWHDPYGLPLFTSRYAHQYIALLGSKVITLNSATNTSNGGIYSLAIDEIGSINVSCDTSEGKKYLVDLEQKNRIGGISCLFSNQDSVNEFINLLKTQQNKKCHDVDKKSLVQLLVKLNELQSKGYITEEEYRVIEEKLLE